MPCEPVPGPATNAPKLDELFAARSFASHTEVAAVLERSAKTLKRLGNDGAIFSRLRGHAWRVGFVSPVATATPRTGRGIDRPQGVSAAGV
jgi:hypothetical protein